MSNNEPRDLIDELETLQRVLDDAASEVDQAKAVPVIEPGADIEDIPVLDELFGAEDQAPADVAEPPVLRAEAGILKAVPSPQQPKTLQDNPLDGLFNEQPAEVYDPNQIADLIGEAMAEPEGTTSSNPFSTNNPSAGNPFLPQSVLDRLAHEREAAQFSAEQAQQTMAKIMGTPAEEKAAQPAASVTPIQSAANAEQSSPAALSELEKAAVIDDLVKEMLPQIEAKLRKILADKL